MNSDIRDLIGLSDRLFSKKQQLHQLWQQQVDHFYPERGDFTASQNSSSMDFAGHLMSSYPLMVRRDMGNLISSILRPNNLQWFHLDTRYESDKALTQKERAWLEWAERQQYKAMYDRVSNFVPATKQGDMDFITFGQTAISVEPGAYLNTLLFRCWHLKNLAWCENVSGEVDTIFRKWKPTLRQLVQLFPKTVSKKVVERMNRDPYEETECLHVMIPRDVYQGQVKGNTRYVSIYIHVEEQESLEEIGSHTKRYVIPRWQTLSESQYGYSPATVCALPDARLLQAMTRVLLEAGEKAVDPPMVASAEAIRSDISIFAGGVTYINADYDERTGEAIRPLYTEMRGIPIGLEMKTSIEIRLREAFYLDKLSLPANNGRERVTTYEVMQQVQEYIRNAAPLFEPMETEYNANLCEEASEIMVRNNGFGRVEDMPERLRGMTLGFRFESPLHDAIEQKKVQQYMTVRDLSISASELDPAILNHLDLKQAFRDAVKGSGAPATWLREEEEAQQQAAQQRAQMQQQQALQSLQTLGAGTKDLASAEQSLSNSQQQAA